MKSGVKTTTKQTVTIIWWIRREETDVLDNLCKSTDKVLIAWNIAYTLLKAKWVNIWNSFFEKDKLTIAKKILKDYWDKIVLPIDHAVCDRDNYSSEDIFFTTVQDIPWNMYGIWLWPKTIKKFNSMLEGDTIQTEKIKEYFYQTSRQESSDKITSWKLSLYK